MYTPLMFCKNMDINNISPKMKLRSVLEDAMVCPGEVLLFLKYDDDFLTPSYTGQFASLNNWLIKNRKLMYKNMFSDPENISEGTIEDKGAAADCFFPYILVNTWSKNKQVYTFDAELELTLSDMDEIKIPVRILDRLPYNTFYIEFAKDGIFASHFHGVFVNFVKHEQGYVLFLMRVTEEGKSMTGSVSFVPDNDNDAYFIINRFRDIEKRNVDCEMDWSEFSMFLLNAVLYLCSENAEIRENKTTIRTYKPSSIVRNKFSEIQKHDCGFIYGETIRKNKKQKKSLENGENKNDSENTAIKTRKEMRPHSRKAHWHHYWVGKGRTELVLRWIAPTTVGYGEKLTTIHRCIE